MGADVGEVLGECVGAGVGEDVGTGVGETVGDSDIDNVCVAWPLQVLPLRSHNLPCLYVLTHAVIQMNHRL